MTKRTNMDVVLEGTFAGMMEEISAITLVKYSLEVFRGEVTKAIAAARADEEYVELSIERKDEFEKGFKILLRKSGIKEGKDYNDIANDWMNYINDVWKLDTSITITAETVDVEVTNPVYYMLKESK